MKQPKLPGDISRIIKRIDNQQVEVHIKDKCVKMKRSQYDQVMKSVLIYGRGYGITPGFYMVDSKTKTCKLTFAFEPSCSDLLIRVNDREFKVNSFLKGHQYV